MFFLTVQVEFTDDDSVPGVDIAVPGAPDIPEANLEEGYMTMSRYQDNPFLILRLTSGREDIRDIFLPVFYRVLDLIKDQIHRVDDKFGPGSLQVSSLLFILLTKHVFLVGGLGSNTFLRRFLLQTLPRQIAVRQPLNGCNPLPKKRKTKRRKNKKQKALSSWDFMLIVGGPPLCVARFYTD